MKQPSFLSRNIVVIVMVPMLIGAHYTWYRLQHVDSLVTSQERDKLQITRVLQNLTFKKEE